MGSEVARVIVRNGKVIISDIDDVAFFPGYFSFERVGGRGRGEKGGVGERLNKELLPVGEERADGCVSLFSAGFFFSFLIFRSKKIFGWGEGGESINNLYPSSFYGPSRRVRMLLP